MICISIAQESRRFALADMFNASRQCDLLEVRLDRFGKAPELGELLAAKPKPVIMSCRRPKDGGHWDGTEDERLALLRQCIISKADYVEIELDAADQVRPFPPSKRVIAYTNTRETPADIADIYAEAQTKKPDVIKLTTLARTPEEAWPLVQILANPPVPTVVMGLGKPGVMLSVLGRKIGAPWTYAALERGMEAYPGQPTVADLRDVYHYADIGPKTRLVGVTGFGPREHATVAALNAAFAQGNLPARCLPLGVGNVRLFRKVVAATHLAAVVDAEHRYAARELATELDPVATRTELVDLVLLKGERWVGHDTQGRSTLAALRARLGADRPLQGRPLVVVGCNDLARGIGRELVEAGCGVVIASHDRTFAAQLAHSLDCRHVPFEGLYAVMHDVLVVCDEEKDSARGRPGIHPGYLKPGMTVLDLTAALEKSPLLREAEARGCAILTPYDLWLDQVALQARLLTGKEVARDLLAGAAPWLLEEE